MNTNSKKMSSLFSEETMDSISLATICGGAETNNCYDGNCGDNCNCIVVTSNISIYFSSCKVVQK